MAKVRIRTKDKPPLTVESIRQLSEDEINSRWKEIQQVLATNQQPIPVERWTDSDVIPLSIGDIGRMGSEDINKHWERIKVVLQQAGEKRND